MVLLRGFAKFPIIAYVSRKSIIKMPPRSRSTECTAGFARLAGMQVLPVNGSTLADEFFHPGAITGTRMISFTCISKRTDTCGESGDFQEKLKPSKISMLFNRASWH
jgi:2,3-bisphosphoglycerate-independent phosphoglycerate mutase